MAGAPDRPRIEFWFDFASTYSYPAAMRVADVAAMQDVEIAWRPFLLGPIFGDLGWLTSPFNLQPAKGAYMWRDLARICAELKLPFMRPDPFPQNGLAAARVATSLPDDGKRAAFGCAVYRAEFGEGATISDNDVLVGILESLGQDPTRVLAEASGQAVKDALRQTTDQAREAGIFGAPTWRTEDGEIFWGNDRLEDAIRWAQQAR